MTWKVANISNPGTSIKFGADDLDKVSKLFRGDSSVDSVIINNSFTIKNSFLKLENPAGTFAYTITPAAIVADRVLNLPLTTATDTLACLGLAQTFTDKITIQKNASASLFELYRTDSATNNGVELDYSLNDSTSTKTTYARIRGEIEDSTNTSEDGSMHFYVMKGGTLTKCMLLNENGELELGPNLRIKFSEAGLTGVRTYTFPDANTELGAGGGGDATLGDTIVQGFVRLEASICPTQITSDQNDYNPTDLATTVKINLNADSSFRTITGLAGGDTGRLIKMVNVSANTILLANENTGSSAANRFALGGHDIPLFEGSGVELIYDAVATRWRLMGQPSVYVIPVSRQGVYVMAHYTADTSVESGLFTEVAASGGTATAVNGVASHPGILDLTFGTSATGSATSKLNNSCILLGNSWYWRYESIIKLTSLSSADPDYTFRSGFIDSGTAESTDGVFFRYNDGVNSGEFQLVARSNSSETATDTNTVPVAGNWTRLTIIVNPAGTSAQGFINGSSVGTVGTTIPTGSGRVCGAGCMFLKTAGTTDASGLQIDSQEIIGYSNVTN